MALCFANKSNGSKQHVVRVYVFAVKLDSLLFHPPLPPTVLVRIVLPLNRSTLGFLRPDYCTHPGQNAGVQFHALRKFWWP